MNISLNADARKIMIKILVVDDSATQRSQLKRDLEAANYQVIEAVNGSDGLEQLVKHKDVGIIILDLNMPEMDGLTMCSKIRGPAITPSLVTCPMISTAVPVVFA